MKNNADKPDAVTSRNFIEEVLSPFRFSAYRFTLKAVDSIILPEYHGSAIRGGFGYAFRAAACRKKRRSLSDDCTACVESHKCLYHYVFETKGYEGDGFLRNKREIAHPYIIRPIVHEDRDEVPPGDELDFELVLIGHAVDYLEIFIYAFIKLGEMGLGSGRGKYILKNVDRLKLNGKGETIYKTGDSRVRMTNKPTPAWKLWANRKYPETCTLRFITRLEMKEHGKTPTIDFSSIFRGIMRRISTLAYFHCGIDVSILDLSLLAREASRVGVVSSNLWFEDGTRFSTRQERWMPFGGIMGDITFSGIGIEFWPFLLIGEWVHTGKKTAFGFGRYQILI
jgi:hypothetical protein